MSRLFGIDKPVDRPYYGLTGFNDANAWITGQGNFTLGNLGRDDASGDPAALYAKGDVFVNFPLTSLYSSAASAMVRSAAGLWYLNLTAAATTYVIGVPLSIPQRKFTNLSGGNVNPKGFKLLDLVFGYTVTTAALTAAPTVAFFTELQANTTARAVTATPYGAVTTENPIGTVGALPTAISANPYVARAYGATPVFINADNTFALAEISIATGAAATAAITFVGAHISWAMY